MTAPVVVGVEDIEHSWHAVTVAVREARLRGAPLWLAHAYTWLPPVASGVMPGADTAEGAVRDAATQTLSTAQSRVRTAFPDVDVHTYAMSGAVAKGLTELAKDAALLVVGGRGRGGFAGLLLGSVALGVIAGARCPVMVVRGEGHPATDRVAVGVDPVEAAGNPGALGFAFEEAALRGAEVRALHIWEDPLFLYPSAVGQYSRSQMDAITTDRAARLAAAVEPWDAKYPDVASTRQVLDGTPSKAFVDATTTADLLVIGARTHRDGVGMHIGGLAHAVLHHAQCPVVIVPEGPRS